MNSASNAVTLSRGTRGSTEESNRPRLGASWKAPWRRCCLCWVLMLERRSGQGRGWQKGILGRGSSGDTVMRVRKGRKRTGRAAGCFLLECQVEARENGTDPQGLEGLGEVPGLPPEAV